MNLNDRIKIMLEENIKQRSTLKEKTYELEALTYKYRKIQNMIQSGQYLQALSSTAAPSPTSLAPIPSSDTANNLIPNIINQKPTPFSILKDNKADTKALEPPPARAAGGLFKSALMSSTTQLTTTNTTSSTNNTTDLTNDYSSSKVMSTATTSTNSYTAGTNSGQGKRAFVAFNCKPNDREASGTEKRTAFNMNIAEDLAQENQIQGVSKDKESLILSKSVDQSKKSIQSMKNTVKQPHKYTTDSSYCSMGADYDVSGRSRKSPNDEDLFTVFSYISNKENNPNRKMNRQAKTEWAGNNFSRWSEGPFCTLMVRKNDSHIAKNSGTGIVVPGEAILKNSVYNTGTRQHKSQRPETRQADETRASCPDIAAKTTAIDPTRTADKNAQPRKLTKYMSQQYEGSKTKASEQRSSRLPRTISMIEYLGLNEFDMIARRHDRLQRRKLIRKQPSYCYEPPSCSCCGSGAHPSMQTTKQGHRMRCNSQSDGDMIFSSSDLLNSGGELVQTSSHLSCSTCCSLGSPTFASHSQLTDETSQSVTSPTMTSISNESNNHHNHHYPSNSQSSTSSSSIVDQENPHTIHFCPHHQPHFYGVHQHAHSTNTNNNTLRRHQQHHQHLRHHHQHNHPLSDPNSSASSVSSIYKNNNQSKSAPHSDEHPLCTSGLHYQGPAPKEDANDAAQLVTTTAANPGGLSAIPTIEDSTEDDEAQQKLLIKCDVLESL